MGFLQDKEETEEELTGEMFDTLHMIDLEAGRWHDVTLKTQATGSKPKVDEKPAGDSEEKEEENNVQKEVSGEFT